MRASGSHRRLARQIRQAVLRGTPEQVEVVAHMVRLLELHHITPNEASERMSALLRDQQP